MLIYDGIEMEGLYALDELRRESTEGACWNFFDEGSDLSRCEDSCLTICSFQERPFSAVISPRIVADKLAAAGMQKKVESIILLMSDPAGDASLSSYAFDLAKELDARGYSDINVYAVTKPGEKTTITPPSEDGLPWRISTKISYASVGFYPRVVESRLYEGSLSNLYSFIQKADYASTSRPWEESTWSLAPD